MEPIARATHRKITPTVVAACLVAAACSGSDQAEPSVSTATDGASVPGIQAINAFYYYDDLDTAWAFYTDVLGFETVVDYGFAKILRVAPASYLTLVNAADGMHSSDEPKSVTLAIVTEEVEGWYDYLSAEGVPMRAELNVQEGSAHDGFVAIDPEGYFLEFERFNPHDENTGLLPRFEGVQALTATQGRRPPELGVHATVFWLYYDELAPLERFYEELFDVDLLVDQGWAKVYPISATGYIGLVDGSRGLHQATEEKGVTLSFLTDDVDAWWARVHDLGVDMRSEEIGMESERVRVFVGYDPAGYFLEWDTFLDRDGNERLMEILGS